MNTKGNFLSGLLFIIVLVLWGIYSLSYQATSGSDTVVVKDKWIENTYSRYGGHSYYLLGTDKGAYKIDDSIWRGQFRSTDLYSCIEKNHSYNIKWYGFRFGFFSEYRNIYEIAGCQING